MAHGELSERIRQHALSRYIRPAKEAGESGLSISVRSLMNDLEAEGFPPNHQAQFCSAMEAKDFLPKSGLKLIKRDGPPSGRSTTVVFHCQFHSEDASEEQGAPPMVTSAAESHSERAFRLTEKLRGLMKEEIASFGGSEAFMRWVRSDEDEEAA